jgi:hypothetical protein
MPFLASSTFLAASPALNPPLETHILWPSASSNLSSCEGKAQGQWCGKCTQAIKGAFVSFIAQIWPNNVQVGRLYLKCRGRGSASNELQKALAETVATLLERRQPTSFIIMAIIS